MDDRDAREKLARTPTLDDLVTLCQHLNDAGTGYVIIGGFAVIHYGYLRGTGDIDLLIDPSPENVTRIKSALSYLPDGAVQELGEDDVARYAVVRIADEIVVDLLSKAGEITYEKARGHIEEHMVNGVAVPYLTVPALIETKQGVRPKDMEDRRFLETLLRFCRQAEGLK